MISILILLGVAVMGVCLLAIALSDRRRPFTIAEVDVDVEPRQPDRSNTPTSRLSGLDLPPDAPSPRYLRGRALGGQLHRGFSNRM